MKEKLMQQIQQFVPFNEQEQTDQKLILSWLEMAPNVSRRENLTAHLTASAWVVTPDRKAVLMAYHKLYDSWAWLGGHADGDYDLLRVAEKEAREESGITGLIPLSREPISLEILTVSGHEKRGAYVPCHLHLNLTYLFQADPAVPLRTKPDENSGVAWIPVEEISEKSTEPWFVERIYSKLVQKAKAI